MAAMEQSSLAIRPTPNQTTFEQTPNETGTYFDPYSTVVAPFATDVILERTVEEDEGEQEEQEPVAG